MNNVLLATVYDAVLAPTEWMGVRAQRRRLMEGLDGRLLEMAAGTGLNVPFYPATATEIHAVEPDRYMLAKLRSKAATQPPSAPLFIYQGDALHLPFADGVFDGAVITFALCTIPDPTRALDETHRVVRAGGVLRFLEHVRSSKEQTARWQDRIAPVWRRFSGGCRLNQPTVEVLEATRWEVDDLWRSGGGSVVAGQAFRA